MAKQGAYAGGIRYGSEFDIGLTCPLTSRLTGKFEAALFREADVLPGTARKADTTRLWFTLTYQH